MRGTLLLAVLIGCTRGDGGHTEADPDSALDGPSSTFDSGRYRADSFVLLEQDQGLDFDDDGTLDNNLPYALGPVDILLGNFSPEELNARVATSIADYTMNVLIGAGQDDQVLSLEILAGMWDADTETMTIDPGSFDGQGNSVVLYGEFSSQTEFRVGPASARVPVTFFDGEPPLPIPLERAVIWGELSETGATGFIAGVVPGDKLVDDVIAKIIPDEGYDSNGDGTIDYTKEALLNLIRGFAEQPTMTDILLDGTTNQRGVSAAFSFSASATTWIE